MKRIGEIFIKVGVTGHRNQRLGLPEDEASKAWEHIRCWISHELSKCIKICTERNEPLELYCGMASGSDIAFGIIADIYKSHYIHSVKLHCILPCKDYNSSHKYFKFLKMKSDEWIELSNEFYKCCDNVRDQYIVDHSDVMLAIWDGNKTGGVWSTIRKAQKSRKENYLLSKRITY